MTAPCRGLTGLSAKSLLPKGRAPCAQAIHTSHAAAPVTRHESDGTTASSDLRRRRASSTTSSQVWCGCGTRTLAGRWGRSRVTRGVCWRSPGALTARVSPAAAGTRRCVCGGWPSAALWRFVCCVGTRTGCARSLGRRFAARTIRHCLPAPATTIRYAAQSCWSSCFMKGCFGRASDVLAAS